MVASAIERVVDAGGRLARPAWSPARYLLLGKRLWLARASASAGLAGAVHRRGRLALRRRLAEGPEHAELGAVLVQFRQPRRQDLAFHAVLVDNLAKRLDVIAGVFDVFVELTKFLVDLAPLIPKMIGALD